MIFSFSPDHWNGKWNTLLFTIPPVPQGLHTCFTANVGSEWLILISYFDSKVIAICLLQEVSDFCLTVRKNPITADITTCQDYSYTCDPFFKEYKCQAEKGKNKFALSLSLTLDYLLGMWVLASRMVHCS